MYLCPIAVAAPNPAVGHAPQQGYPGALARSHLPGGMDCKGAGESQTFAWSGCAELRCGVIEPKVCNACCIQETFVQKGLSVWIACQRLNFIVAYDCRFLAKRQGQGYQQSFLSRALLWQTHPHCFFLWLTWHSGLPRLAAKLTGM